VVSASASRVSDVTPFAPAVDMAPYSPASTVHQITRQLGTIAKTLFDRGSLREAIAILGPITETTVDPAILSLAARIHSRLGEPERAIPYLCRAVRLDQNNDKALERLEKLSNQLQPKVAKLSNRLQKTTEALLKKPRFRDSLGDVMQFAQSTGFEPGCIIDVGIATGTPGLYEAYPNAMFVLFDPIEENEVFMKDLCVRYPQARYYLAAAGRHRGRQTISVDPSYSGSRFVAAVGRHVHGVDREVPVLAIDDVVAELGCHGPFIIKVDTEGSELEVLEGAHQVMQHTDMLILESRTWPIGNAPQLYEILHRLRAWGFVAYDIINRNYNDAAGFLKQFDLIAVKEHGFFRQRSSYRNISGSEPVDQVLNEAVTRKLSKRQALLDQLGERKARTQIGGVE
jgi:FkbM family methyltransferase